MKTSKAMEELYKIKEECSLHLSSLAPTERIREFQRAVDWYEKASGKPVTTLDGHRSSGTRKEELAQV